MGGGVALQRGGDRELPHQLEGEALQQQVSLTSTGSSSRQRCSASSRAEHRITTDVLSAPILPTRSRG